jgi:hypothetical protein
MMFKLVTKPPAEPHAFPPIGEGRHRMPADPARGRHEQIERSCPKCALVKITVMPRAGGAWREWRSGDAPGQFIDVVTPECVAVEAQRADLRENCPVKTEATSS